MNTPPTTPLLAVVPSADNLSAAILAALPTLRRPRYIKLPLDKLNSTELTVLAAQPLVLSVDAAALAFEAPSV